ncbi:YqzL family protein [Jeotgalibacillus proteolyticus]|uniref:YqzL family protein n=1 Tax=Jeotgalibacillus proteolyticus TaxID=2082395 RepID=A0A2S5GEV3_9BACL|nr:YqzL family protein [Jeotgalibacillus proteolyticus]PPA71445.1 YqzL family protein [Jeotgalibacillus proteolyticus]
MLNFTWEVFSQTGDVELYLLFKEIEGEDFIYPGKSSPLSQEEEQGFNSTV